MLCPIANCGQLMEPDYRAGYDARTGLECLHCAHCGHRGLRARDGMQLLFTGQHEYVFSYGPSLSYLKIVLSTVALNLFRTQGLEPARLATHVAEWALLMGQVCGTTPFRRLHAVQLLRVLPAADGEPLRRLIELSLRIRGLIDSRTRISRAPYYHRNCQPESAPAARPTNPHRIAPAPPADRRSDTHATDDESHRARETTVAHH